MEEKGDFMKYVWEAFIDEYGNELHHYPLLIILKAFWHYEKYKKDCKLVFEHYDNNQAEKS